MFPGLLDVEGKYSSIKFVANYAIGKCFEGGVGISFICQWGWEMIKLWRGGRQWNIWTGGD